MREAKPIWTSASFLVYLGGLTVLFAAIAALVYLATQYRGAGEETAWALLVLVVLYAIAHALRLRGRTLAAGIFAFASVIAWGIFVAVLFHWWGWNGVSGSFSRWSWSRLALWLLILAAAWDDRRRFRFPLIRLISAVVCWIFVIDLITSGGSFTVAVTLVVGLAYLLAGSILNARPSSFWLHVVGGLLIGGSLLYWLHSGDVEWAFVGVFSVLYMAVGTRLARSSWTVLGALGLLLVASRYSVIWSASTAGTGWTGYAPVPKAATSFVVPTVTGFRPWAAIVTFAVLGFLYVALGLLASRRRAALAAPAAG